MPNNRSTAKSLVIVFLLCFALTSYSAPDRPNFILVVLDDMTPSDAGFLPKTSQYLATDGIQFRNAFVPTGLCAPARASILTGNYPQNTGVYKNERPSGGFEAFFLNGNESKSIATWLHDRGYSTALIGKYLNYYGFSQLVPKNHIPAGWDEWFGLTSTVKYYGYTLNENGTLKTYGTSEADYATDVISSKAGGVLTKFAATGRPFFMYIAPFAPHSDGGAYGVTPAKRHASLFEGVAAPRSSSFNERDVSDKPPRIQELPTLTEADVNWIDRSFRLRVQSLQAVDEMIALLIDKLVTTGALANTYLIFTSDHGFFFGDHRMRDGKVQMYEPANRVPLLIAGPNIKAGRHRQEIVSNIDLFPTIADLAFSEVPLGVDGRSFARLLRTDARGVSDTRKGLLRTRGTNGAGIRLPSYSYTESYALDGTVSFRELYDLLVDPDETNNVASNLTPKSMEQLSMYASELRKCVGLECHRLEDFVGDWLVKFVVGPAKSLPTP